MKKSADILLTTVLNTALTALFVFLLSLERKSIGVTAGMGIIFFIVSFIILSLLIKSLAKFIKVFRLKGLKLNSYAYYLYPLTLLIIAGTVYMIIFRAAGWHAPMPVMAGAVIISVLFLIAAQLGGAFPEVFEGDRKTVIRHESAGSFPGGFEIIASMSGSYDGGILLGVTPIPSQGFVSMHRSEDAVIIEGQGHKKTEVVLLSEKSKAFFTKLLGEKLRMPEKEVKKGMSIKNSVKNSPHFKNREQRRREMRNKSK